MDILEKIRLPILAFPKGSTEIEAYEHDLNRINIFYSISDKNEKFFLLEVQKDKLRQQDLRKSLCDVIEHPHGNLLKLTNFSPKDENSVYLCYEFTDILLSKYIQNAQPALEIRISLMRQFIELLMHFHVHQIRLDYVDINYIFVENLEDPVLKILYNGGFLERNETLKAENLFITSHEFYWIVFVYCIIFRVHSSEIKINNLHNATHLFYETLEVPTKMLFQNLLNNSINKIKNLDTSEYSFLQFVNDFNKILEAFNMPVINATTVKNSSGSDDVYKKYVVLMRNKEQEQQQSNTILKVQHGESTASNCSNLGDTNHNNHNHNNHNMSNMSNAHVVNNSVSNSSNTCNINTVNNYQMTNNTVNIFNNLQGYYNNYGMNNMSGVNSLNGLNNINMNNANNANNANNGNMNYYLDLLKLYYLTSVNQQQPLNQLNQHSPLNQLNHYPVSRNCNNPFNFPSGLNVNNVNNMNNATHNPYAGINNFTNQNILHPQSLYNNNALNFFNDNPSRNSYYKSSSTLANLLMKNHSAFSYANPNSNIGSYPEQTNKSNNVANNVSNISPAKLEEDNSNNNHNNNNNDIVSSSSLDSEYNDIVAKKNQSSKSSICIIKKKRKRKNESSSLDSNSKSKVNKSSSKKPSVFRKNNISNKTSTEENPNVVDVNMCEYDADYIETLKKTSLKVELEHFKHSYEKELSNISTERGYSFMKSHFPEMFKLENFYLYLKLKRERGTNLRKLYAAQIKNENNSVLYNKDIEGSSNIISQSAELPSKKIWDSALIDLKQVKEYLILVDKIWPYDQYTWSEESALEFLLMQNFKEEVALEMIKSRDQTFTDFIAEKFKFSEKSVPKENKKRSSRRNMLNV